MKGNARTRMQERPADLDGESDPVSAPAAEQSGATLVDDRLRDALNVGAPDMALGGSVGGPLELGLGHRLDDLSIHANENVDHLAGGIEAVASPSAQDASAEKSSGEHKGPAADSAIGSGAVSGAAPGSGSVGGPGGAAPPAPPASQATLEPGTPLLTKMVQGVVQGLNADPEDEHGEVRTQLAGLPGPLRQQVLDKAGGQVSPEQVAILQTPLEQPRDGASGGGRSAGGGASGGGGGAAAAIAAAVGGGAAGGAGGGGGGAAGAASSAGGVAGSALPGEVGAGGGPPSGAVASGATASGGELTPAATAEPPALTVPESGAGHLDTTSLATIDVELAEHERWGSAAEAVGAAGSEQRAAFVAEAAGAGLLQGAASGFAQGAEWGLIGRAATTFVPLPGVGQVVGGYQAVMGLAEKDWGAAGQTIANIGQGSDTYEILANSIASVAEIIDIITNVMNVAAGVCGTVAVAAGIVAAVALAAAFFTAGASLAIAGPAGELASTMGEMAVEISEVANELGEVNSLILQPCVMLFRAMHAFTSEADPREVEANGASIGQAAGSAGGFLGGMAGGKLANAGQPTPTEEGQAPRPNSADPPEGTVAPAAGDGPTLQVEPPPGMAQGDNPAALPAADATATPQLTDAPASQSPDAAVPAPQSSDIAPQPNDVTPQSSDTAQPPASVSNAPADAPHAVSSKPVSAADAPVVDPTVTPVTPQENAAVGGDNHDSGTSTDGDRSSANRSNAGSDSDSFAPSDADGSSGDLRSVDPLGPPLSDPAPPAYDYPQMPVEDHILNRARGGTDSPDNIDIKTWEANSRKGGLEGNYDRDVQRYVDQGLTPEQARYVLQDEHNMILNDVHPRPVDPQLLDTLPNQALDPPTVEFDSTPPSSSTSTDPDPVPTSPTGGGGSSSGDASPSPTPSAGPSPTPLTPVDPPIVDIGPDLASTAADVDNADLALNEPRGGAGLRELLPNPEQRLETRQITPRNEADRSARGARRQLENQTLNPPDANGQQRAGTPQPGDEMGHMAASRHYSRSGIPMDIAQHPDNIDAIPAQSKDATVTNQNGRVTRTDPHAAQERVINESFERAMKRPDGTPRPPGTVESSMAHQEAMAETKIRSEYFTRRHLDEVRRGGLAAPEPGPPVDPATGRVIVPPAAAAPATPSTSPQSVTGQNVTVLTPATPAASDNETIQTAPHSVTSGNDTATPPAATLALVPSSVDSTGGGAGPTSRTGGAPQENVMADSTLGTSRARTSATAGTGAAARGSTAGDAAEAMVVPGALVALGVSAGMDAFAAKQAEHARNRQAAEAAHNAQFTADNQPGPGVVRVNPNYQAPPGTPEQLQTIKDEIANLLDARARAEQAELRITEQERQHQSQQGPAQDAVQGTQQAITATQAHQQNVERRRQANQQQEDKRKQSEQLISGWPSRAAGLMALKIPLAAFRGFLWLATELPGAAGASMQKMSDDADHMEQALDQMDVTMNQQAQAQAPRQQELASDQGRIETTGESAVQSSETLTQANEGALAFQQENESRLAQATQAKDEAIQQGAEIDDAVDVKQQQAETYAQEMQSWASEHQAARQSAIQETRQPLENEGYIVTENREGSA